MAMALPIVTSSEDRVSSSALIFGRHRNEIGFTQRGERLTINFAETDKLTLATGHSGIYSTAIWSSRYVSKIAR